MMSFANITSSQNLTYTNNQYRESKIFLNESFIMIVKLMLYVIMILISLFGNFLIILVIYYDKSMRKSTNFFIFNLAICDLAIIFSSAWIQILLVISDNWLLGKQFCKISSYLEMVSIKSSVLTLAVISYDRYNGILYPLKTATTDNRNKYYLIIVFIWFVSLILSIPTYFYRTYTERLLLGTVRTSCGPFHRGSLENLNELTGLMIESSVNALAITLKRLYYTLNICLLFFLPFLIMAVMYTIVIKKLWQNYNNSNMIACSFKKERLVRKNKKIILMLVLMLVSFFICWY